MTNEYQAVEIMESVKVDTSWADLFRENQHNWKWQTNSPRLNWKKYPT